MTAREVASVLVSVKVEMSGGRAEGGGGESLRLEGGRVNVDVVGVESGREIGVRLRLLMEEERESESVVVVAKEAIF